jgi:predicted neuraminidase
MAGCTADRAHARGWRTSVRYQPRTHVRGHARAAALRVTLLAAALFTPAPALKAGELTISRVFGPEIATGPYKHPASMTELDNGDLYLIYYGGSDEYATETAVFGARLKKGETRWSTPLAVARDPFRSVGNGVVWQAPDGVVWLFYVVRFGATWSTSRVQVKISRDQTATWSDASVLSLDQGTMVRNRPIVLDNGDYLLPIYHETGFDTEKVGADSTSRFLRFDRGKKTWTPSGEIRSPRGNIQPAVVPLSERDLIAYCRRGGDYDPRTIGYIVRSESHDGGLTWSEGTDSRFPNPNAAIDFIKLKSGRLLLIYNDSMTRRTPLTAALSFDQDRSWPVRRNLCEGDHDYAYPSAFQARDGKIHVVFTSDRRSVVNHAIFDEDWVIKAGKAPLKK